MLRPSHFLRPVLWDSTQAEAPDSPSSESCARQRIRLITDKSDAAVSQIIAY